VVRGDILGTFQFESVIDGNFMEELALRVWSAAKVKISKAQFFIDLIKDEFFFMKADNPTLRF